MTYFCDHSIPLAQIPVISSEELLRDFESIIGRIEHEQVPYIVLHEGRACFLQPIGWFDATFTAEDQQELRRLERENQLPKKQLHSDDRRYRYE